MNLQECYAVVGGDYEDVIGRFMNKESLVLKFVLKFPEDGSFDLLCRSLEEGNMDEAFRAAHTMKGVCQNLSFTRLQKSSSALTEALRAAEQEKYDGLLEQVATDYHQTVDAIRALDL